MVRHILHSILSVVLYDGHRSEESGNRANGCFWGNNCSFRHRAPPHNSLLLARPCQWRFLSACLSVCQRMELRSLGCTVKWERMLGRMNINGVLAFFVSRCRSLPKLSSQDEEGGAGHGFGGTHAHFEPIPHDHDFCERVVINVSIPPLERRVRRRTWKARTNADGGCAITQ